MSMTREFFDAVGRRGGALIEDVDRGGMIDVRLTEQGMDMWKQQHLK